jgi:hypothetical protein
VIPQIQSIPQAIPQVRPVQPIPQIRLAGGQLSLRLPSVNDIPHTDVELPRRPLPLSRPISERTTEELEADQAALENDLRGENLYAIVPMRNTTRDPGPIGSVYDVESREQLLAYDVLPLPFSQQPFETLLEKIKTELKRRALLDTRQYAIKLDVHPFFDKMNKHRLESNGTDLVIQSIDETEFPIHKSMLTSNSEYFEKLFDYEAAGQTVILIEEPKEMVELFIKFIYYQPIRPNRQQFWALLDTLSYYQIKIDGITSLFNSIKVPYEDAYKYIDTFFDYLPKFDETVVNNFAKHLYDIFPKYVGEIYNYITKKVRNL